MESGLAKITLEWIALQAKAAGLLLDPSILAIQLGQKPSVSGTQHSPPDAKATLHKSLKGFWWLLEILPRKQWSFKDYKMHWSWGPSRPRWMERGSLVHQSLEDRKKLVREYRPVNLPANYQIVG